MATDDAVVPTTIQLRPDQLRALQQEAAQRSRGPGGELDLAAIVREIVDEWVERRGGKMILAAPTTRLTRSAIDWDAEVAGFKQVVLAHIDAHEPFRGKRGELDVRQALKDVINFEQGPLAYGSQEAALQKQGASWDHGPQKNALYRALRALRSKFRDHLVWQSWEWRARQKRKAADGEPP